jgi:hypothetical protein
MNGKLLFPFEISGSFILVVFNLEYSYPWVYANTSYFNQNETHEPLEPRTSSDPRTHEDSSPN